MVEGAGEGWRLHGRGVEGLDRLKKEDDWMREC